MKEMKLIYEAYASGTYSYEKIELDSRFGLKYAKGMNAYRICKRYQAQPIVSTRNP